MSFAVYQEYKSSLIDWCNEIPVEWSVISLRWSTLIYAGGTPSKDNLDFWTDGTVPWLNSGAVNQTLINEPSAYITEEALAKSSAKWIPKGALVIALAGQGKTKGMVAQLDIGSTCNQSMAAIIPKRIKPRFLFYWLSSNYQNIRNLAGGDDRDGLNLELLAGIKSPLPSALEQKQIARFLDHEVSKIDALIAEQEKLIALLKEKRQAVISHAVTKGLNPDAPMKDSGVEWLGQVPVHWVVLNLKYLCTIQGGFAFNSESMTEEGVQVVRIGNLYQNVLDLERQPIFVEKTLVDELPNFVITNGDILMSLTGTLGKRDYGFAVKVESSEPLLMNQRVAKIIPDNLKILSDYLINVLRSDAYLSALYSLPSGTKQANLSNGDVLGIKVTLPPDINEQLEIANFVDFETQKYERLLKESIEAIDYLIERRSALISAAVTGKIDVRGWQPPVEKINPANKEVCVD
ncbi:restriction endonuclease subunit S [Alishewanella sp. 16-MA]|uniref:Restriction endonuclease subunit S n=1 Tax=Alishewanella maricola TaxID=2795740 RepID=A0ABS8C5M7_9ALTE|nr:restriction endonuclease subunit S [Alishewanella maricola]MCB5227649.1 restriction endonuclease subunit S [Alishewanella maricola]